MNTLPSEPALRKSRHAFAALLLGLLASSTARAAAHAAAHAAYPCVQRPTAAEVQTHLEASRQAHFDKKAEPYAEEWRAGRAAALCASGLLDAHTVWMFNLLEGIDATARADPAHAIASYQVAQQVDPSFSFTDDWVFPEHAIRKQYDAARARPVGAEVGVWAPKRGTLTLNGVATEKRSPDLPVLWQYSAPGGAVSSGYVPEGEAPPWDAPWGQGARQRHAWSRGLTIGAVSTGAAAVAAGAASFYFRGQINAYGDQIHAGYSEGLEQKIDTAGKEMAATGVAGAGLAGAALTLGTVAIAVNVRW